jgi:hypothetical protein
VKFINNTTYIVGSIVRLINCISEGIRIRTQTHMGGFYTAKLDYEIRLEMLQNIYKDGPAMI